MTNLATESAARGDVQPSGLVSAKTSGALVGSVAIWYITLLPADPAVKWVPDLLKRLREEKAAKERR